MTLHKSLFGVDVKKISGDTGYAGAENRDFCKENGIQASFVKRGRPSGEENKMKDAVRQEFFRVRATEMEGYFGTQKEYYDLRRVKARTKKKEILYIFFGVHMANVVSWQIESRKTSAVNGSLTLKDAHENVPFQGELPRPHSADEKSGQSGRNEL